ncbi:hypothetical protein OH76DRAFT_461618 [Lentinus brumalis]|uniref:Uncharacterized protein n=1 Tax=Lentinus brumalis TaxID=2498619 RepID=A0A371CIF5_9APHY|nr:hypothetical protein OH76DRAFT_461618 [Polyporus brumalis]
MHCTAASWILDLRICTLFIHVIAEVTYVSRSHSKHEACTGSPEDVAQLQSAESLFHLSKVKVSAYTSRSTLTTIFRGCRDPGHPEHAKTALGHSDIASESIRLERRPRRCKGAWGCSSQISERLDSRTDDIQTDSKAPDSDSSITGTGTSARSTTRTAYVATACLYYLSAIYKATRITQSPRNEPLDAYTAYGDGDAPRTQS